MIDLKLIREQPEVIRRAVKDKQAKVDVEGLLRVDKTRRKLITEVETLRATQNKASEKIAKAGKAEKAKLVKEMKEVAQKIKQDKSKLDKLEEEFSDLLLLLPNPPDESVPVGKDETENVVLRKWQEPTQFDFKPQDHLDLALKLDLVDIERAAKISGSRFYYLKGEAVLLEFALTQFAFKLLSDEGFVPIVPPVLVKEEIMQGGGYLPGGADEIYKTTKDDLYLVGTSEQSILGMYAAEILEEKLLPLRYVGFSSCFRREAGSYGKDTRGIFRVHQFDKIEMFSFCLPEASLDEHEYFLSLEEKIMQQLKIPYQVVVMCTGDLGLPAAKKYDIEAWIPSQEKYRETHSTSNCTDFQARRLNIRYRNKDGKASLIHTINGTAIAIGRMIIAILENFQQKNGSIKVPAVLQPYLEGKKVI